MTRLSPNRDCGTKRVNRSYHTSTTLSLNIRTLSILIDNQNDPCIGAGWYIYFKVWTDQGTRATTEGWRFLAETFPTGRAPQSKSVEHYGWFAVALLAYLGCGIIRRLVLLAFLKNEVLGGVYGSYTASNQVRSLRRQK